MCVYTRVCVCVCVCVLNTNSPEDRQHEKQSRDFFYVL